jgi:hypothetical protein
MKLQRTKWIKANAAQAERGLGGWLKRPAFPIAGTINPVGSISIKARRKNNRIMFCVKARASD